MNVVESNVKVVVELAVEGRSKSDGSYSIHFHSDSGRVGAKPAIGDQSVLGGASWSDS